jgi:hypothetical protein
MDVEIIGQLEPEMIPELVENFFKDYVTYIDGSPIQINQAIFYELDEQEACRLLVALIEFWRGRKRIFCEEFDLRDPISGELVFDEDTGKTILHKLGFKTPSKHGWCVQAQIILDRIFGKRLAFLQLPFVRACADRYYEFDYDDLKYFAEHGRQAYLERGRQIYRDTVEILAELRLQEA